MVEDVDLLVLVGREVMVLLQFRLEGEIRFSEKGKVEFPVN